MLEKLKRLRYIAAVAVMLLFFPLVAMVIDFGKNFEQSPKIGIITLGDINVPGWNKSHYDGIKAACDRFGLELLVRDNVPENTGRCPAAIRELVQEGADMIFLSSFNYAVESKESVEKFHNIAFATNSSEVHTRNLTSYFPRMYQARYLSGTLAGMKTKSNVIGYVAAIPNAEVIRGIDAFTLGVQRVNPDATVVVIWTNSWQDEVKEKINAERLITEVGADVLTYHQDEDTVAKVAEKFGVDFIAYNAILSGYSEHYLASVYCDWELYYIDMIERYLKGELNTMKNHWLGIDRGAVGLREFSSAVTPEMIAKIDSFKQELIGNRQIFFGPLYDIDGEIICEDGDAISDDVLFESMNRLVKGVEILE